MKIEDQYIADVTLYNANLNFEALTSDKIYTVTNELRDYACWCTVIELAKTMYGPTVHTVYLETDYPWNDGDPTHLDIESMSAKDSTNHTLDYDLSSPFFDRYFKYYEYDELVYPDDEVPSDNWEHASDKDPYTVLQLRKMNHPNLLEWLEDEIRNYDSPWDLDLPNSTQSLTNLLDGNEQEKYCVNNPPKLKYKRLYGVF